MPEAVHPAVSEAIMEYARYQTELAISDHSLVDVPPSEIALAAIYNALDGVDSTLIPEPKQILFKSTIVNVLCHIDAGCMTFAFEERVGEVQLQIQQILARVIAYVRSNEKAESSSQSEDGTDHSGKKQCDLPHRSSKSPVTVMNNDC
jgi:hypothetical protein